MRSAFETIELALSLWKGRDLVRDLALRLTKRDTLLTLKLGSESPISDPTSLPGASFPCSGLPHHGSLFNPSSALPRFGHCLLNDALPHCLLNL